MEKAKIVVAKDWVRKSTWLGKQGEVLSEQITPPGKQEKRKVPLQYRRKI